MADEMRVQIQEAIEKNLPAQVGDVLRQQLTELDDLRMENAHTNEQLGLQTEHIEKLQGENIRMNDLLGDIEARETAVVSKGAELDLLKNKLVLDQQKCDLVIAHSTEKVSLVREMFEIPFKNRTLRESLLTQVPVRSDFVQPGPYDAQTQSNSQTVVPSETLETKTDDHTVEEG